MGRIGKLLNLYIVGVPPRNVLVKISSRPFLSGIPIPISGVGAAATAPECGIDCVREIGCSNHNYLPTSFQAVHE